jgi:RNA polymerase sigma-70 factor, ECF subfamily
MGRKDFGRSGESGCASGSINKPRRFLDEIVMTHRIARTDRRLIDGLRASDPSAVEELISRYSARLQRFLRRRGVVAAEAAALGGDIFQAIVESVRRNALPEPAALAGLVWTVARRRVALRRTRADRKEALRRQALAPAVAARAVLAGMPERDREVLIRFYLGEQTPEEICAGLRLTATQFQLVKSQARSQFGRLGCQSAGMVRRMSGLREVPERRVA